MKSLFYGSLFIFLFGLKIISAQTTPLHDTYTIGKSGNYPSFTAAINALVTNGISGPVTFNIENDTFNEQLTIPEIEGCDSINTITFQSESQDSTSVTIIYEATANDRNYTLKLDGADYITFNRVTLQSAHGTYGTVIEINDTSNHNTFSNCVLRGIGGTGTSSYLSVVYAVSKNEHNHFKNNRIVNGSYGFYYYGLSADVSGGTVIENNILENQYVTGIFLYYQNSCIVRNNSVITNSVYNSFIGIYVSYCTNRIRIEKNRIYNPNGGYGIYLNYCQSTSVNQGLISNNFIRVGGTATAIGIYLYITDNQKIYNNNILITGTSVDYGRALVIDGYKTYNYSNSILNNILVNTGGGYALYVSSTSTSNNNINVSDCNDLCSTGQNLAYWWGNMPTLKDLQKASSRDLNSISHTPLFYSDNDLHVREVWLNAAGKKVSEVEDDIDGDPRDYLKPDIGADEFDPPQTDAGIYSLTAPKVPFPAGNNDVIVVLKNHGGDTLKNVTIEWTINGMAQEKLEWHDLLVSGDTVSVKLGKYVFNAGTAYSIKSWTTLPNGKADGITYNDTIGVNNLYAGLAETYTIGGSNPDFTSFEAAVNALTLGGISANVMFDVRNGTYPEQISIPEIKGTSEAATITFKSELGDSTKVILTYSGTSANNYTLQLNGADHIKFYRVTLQAASNAYGRVIDIKNSSNYNTFSNCILQGISTSNTSSVYSVVNSDYSKNEYNAFINNRISDGSIGLYYLGASTSDVTRGTIIENNIFENQYYAGIYLYYHNSVVIRNNTINTSSNYTAYNAIRAYYCYNQSKIEKNKLYVPRGGYGINLSYCRGTSSARGLISNNFIYVGGTGTAYGIALLSSDYQNIYNNNILVSSSSASDSRALNLQNYNVYTNTNNIVNNVLANTGGGYALYVSSTSLINTSDNNDLFTSGENIAYWDGNRTDLADLRSASGRDLNSISQDPLYYSNTDLHVREVWLNTAGRPLTEITDDIDGDPRDDLQPDIGADEFNAINVDAGIYALASPVIPFPSGSNDIVVVLKNHGSDTLKNVGIDWSLNGDLPTRFDWHGKLASGDTTYVKLEDALFMPGTAYSIKSWTTMPNGNFDVVNYNDTIRVVNLYAALSGKYTIGGSNPDFIYFRDAVNALNMGGITDDVVFKVRNDTYNDQISIPEIRGTSDQDSITFESESGDSSKVILNYSAGTSNTNYVVRLDGVDYIKFYRLTLQATGNSYARVIDIKNGSGHNTFSNCILLGKTNAGSSNNLAVVYCYTSKDEYNTFKNNTISDGSYGIYYYGLSSNDFTKGTVIENNIFENQYYTGIYLYYQNSFVIRNNTINTNLAYTSYHAINVFNCNDQLKIEKNKLYVSKGNCGIYLSNTTGTSSNQGLISNNFIQVGGTSSAYGIHLYGSYYQRIYNNNIHITGTSASNGRSLIIENSSLNSINIKNNILANSANGYALYVTSSSSIGVSDYNDLFTTGEYIAYWSGSKENLSDLWSESNKDLNSISINPLYVSETDLHVREITLNGSGDRTAEITDDIDGDVRDSLSPDIGADEFAPLLTDAGIFSLASPAIPISVGNQDVIVVLKNHGSDTLKEVTIEWTINGNKKEEISWSGSLLTGNTANIKLGSYLFSADTAYSIKSWTTMPNGNPDAINLNDTLTINNLFTALKGIYTIGGSNPKFTNFQTAIDALNDRGIAGNVIFKVRNYTYNEQISISEIDGASEEATITFESESGDSSKVILSYSSGSSNNYILKLNGANYFKFYRLTLEATGNSYGRVIDISNGSSHNTFAHCILSGKQNSYSGSEFSVIHSYSAKNEYNSFINNRISNGSYGIYYSGMSATDLTQNLFIDSNTFENQYNTGIYLNYLKSVVISNNKINTNSSSSGFYAISCNYCNNPLKIEKNKLYAPNGGYGIYLIACKGTDSNQGLIANNFIQVGGTGTAYGIYSTSEYQRIYNNNIHITGTSTSNGRAICVDSYYSINYHLSIKNNILVNTGGGYTLYVNNSSSVEESDYNNFYKTGPYIAYWSDNMVDLNDLRSTSKMDSNSLAVNPLFVSDTDLHVRELALNGSGLHLSEIYDDIDGEVRDTIHPDIGADEFGIAATGDAGIISVSKPKSPFIPSNQGVYVTLRNFGSDLLTSVTIHWEINKVAQETFYWEGSLASGATDTVRLGSFDFHANIAYTLKAWSVNPNGVADNMNYNDTVIVNNLYTAMNGSYTIGGISPDFKTFSEAVNRLKSAGVTGTVTFLVRQGSYREHVSVSEVPGATALNRIIFQSEGEDSTAVVLTDSAGLCIITLNGADYITFRKLTIRNSNGKGIELKNSASHNYILNNVIQANHSSYEDENRAAIFSSNSSCSFNQIRNNKIINGNYGIVLQGNLDNFQSENIITDNTFSEQTNGAIKLHYQESPDISNNTITLESNYSTPSGCYLYYCQGLIRVSKNKINLVNDGYGINLTNNSASLINRGLIANNFVSVGGSTNSNGIYLSDNDFLDICNNSINLRNTNATAAALYYNNGADNNFFNNSIANTGDGYSLWVGELISISGSDYNNLYTSGTALVYYNNKGYENLDSWKQDCNKESHSISSDPLYTSDFDLHSSQAAMDSNGISLPSVTDDIDGDQRDQQFPDIGADEFSNFTHNVGITAILPESSCSLGDNESVIATVKNFGANAETGFNVTYQIDSLQPVTETITQMVPAGGTIRYTFNGKVNLSNIKNYMLKAYTGLTGDEIPGNDTIVRSIASMIAMEITVTKDTSVCAGTGVTLYASGAEHYKWSNGNSYKTIQVNPLYTTMYIVTATNVFDCEDSDTVIVTVKQNPVQPIISTSGPTTFCHGNSVILTSSVDQDITWSTGQNTPAISVIHSGEYTVKHTNSAGCSAISLPVRIIEEPAPVIVPHDLTVCSADSIVLSVKNAVSYLWSTNSNQSSITIRPEVSSTYSVTAKTPLGCTFTDVSTITVLASKTPGQVTNILPADGTTELSLPLDVSWIPSENANNYNLYVWLANEQRPSTPLVSGINSIRYSFDNTMLAYGSTYKWEVSANYFGCESTIGPVQTFNIRELPDIIVNDVQTPISAFSGQSIDVTWEMKNIGKGSTINQHWKDRIYFSTDEEFGTDLFLLDVPKMTYLAAGASYERTATITIPEYRVGNYYVVVKGDVYNQLTETNDSNNYGRNIEPIWVKLTPPPDLQVTSIVAPKNVFSEQTYNINWTVTNKGEGNTTVKHWLDRVYISKDFKNGRKYELGTFVHDQDTLHPEEGYTVSYNVTLPIGITGTYFFYVETDVLNQEKEHAYDGNNVTQSDTVNVLLAPPPDLVVSDIAVLNTPNNADGVLLEWTVENQGAPASAVAVKGWYDKIYITESADTVFDNAYRFDYRWEKFGLESYFSGKVQKLLDVPQEIPQGYYYIYVETDTCNEVFEYLSENNNIARLADPVYIGIKPWADLRVTEIQTADSASVGEKVPIRVTVKNFGKARTNVADWSDYIYFCYDSIIGPHSVKELLTEARRTSYLDPGESYIIHDSIELPDYVTKGSRNYYIIVKTDFDNDVYELVSDSNNATRIPIFILPGDLSIPEIVIPDTIYAGQSLSVSWNIKNIGKATTPDNYWRDIAYSSFSKVSEINNFCQLESGESYAVRTTFKVPLDIQGKKMLYFSTDVTNENHEWNTKNNTRIDSIYVKEVIPSDLVIAPQNIPQQATSGQPVTISWVVKNEGKVSTNTNLWKDKIYLSRDFILDKYDVLLGEYRRSPGLEAGESYIASKEANIPIWAVGNYVLMIVTDFEDVVYEDNEINNVLTPIISLIQPPPSDLVVTKIELPDTAAAGDFITVNWTIRNNGPNPAKGIMTDMVYFSRDQVWDKDDIFFGELRAIINLNPSQELSRKLTEELKSVSVGDYYIIVRTDNGNNIFETDDENNSLTSLDNMYVRVEELPIGVMKYNILVNAQPLYYRLQIPDSLFDETLIISLTGDTANGNNELYLKHIDAPTRAEHDYGFEKPFSGNQELIVPSTDTGTYYLMVYGISTVNDSQNISLLARILNFEIRTVHADEGGNTGKVTTEVRGAKFTDSMKVGIANLNDTIWATRIIFVNAAKVFVTFDLTGARLGSWDVIAVKPERGETTVLPGGFKVVEGVKTGLVSYVQYPRMVRLGLIFTMTVQYANSGNVDIPNPIRIIKSHGGAPIGIKQSDLLNWYTEYQLEYTELYGPDDILRPGAVGEIVIYSRAVNSCDYAIYRQRKLEIPTGPIIIEKK